MKRAKYLLLLWFLVLGLAASCTIIRELWEPADVLAILQKDVDKISPVVTITSPTNGQAVGSTYQMTGTVSDTGSGVKTVYISFDGKNWQFAELSGNTWTATLNAPVYGVLTNYVYAEDKAGNKSATLSVWVERTSIPSVVILSPANWTYTNETSITLSGAASVDAPFTLTKVQVQLNGGGWADATGTTNWTGNLTLVEGTNTIIARAIADNAKTNTSMEWKIVYEKAVHVSVDGDDANCGIRTAPLRSLPVAINKARTLGFNLVRVASGTYTPGAGLNSSPSGVLITNITGLNIVGGYNTDFSAQTGFSVLDGSNAVYHVVWIVKATNLVFDGFVVMQGRASGTGGHNKGGGLVISNSGALDVTNCLVTNNSATLYGGGIYIYQGSGHTLSGTVSGNVATEGGGAYLYYGTNHTVGGTVSGNFATNFGGGICLQYGKGHTLDGTISGNTCIVGYGGGTYIIYGNGFAVNGTVSGNTANNGGGGLYIDYSTNCSVGGTISANISGADGGGVAIKNSGTSSIGGTISGNTVTSYGGGVSIWTSSGHTLNGTISGNTAGISGGGVFFFDTNANSTHTFQNTVIQDNTNYGVYRWNTNSDPQGLATVTTNGNTPTFKNW